MKLSDTVPSAALCLAVLLTPLSTVLAAEGPEATSAPASEPSSQPGPDFGPDAIGPMVIPMVMVLVAIIIILIGFGAVLAVVAVLALAMLVGLGIVSTSVSAAILHRRARTGFRIFFLLAGAAGGVPSGIVLLMAAGWLFHPGLSTRWTVGMGAIAGALAGLAVAEIFNFAWGRIIDYLARKVGRR